MKKILLVSICFFTLLSSGCTIVQTAKPVSIGDLGAREICVIENPAVDKAFLPAYKAALEKKGFSIKVQPPETAAASCLLSSTYIGKWSWDFKPYMAYAEIIVYQNGVPAGNALYQAPRAGWSMTTRIYESTESKIAKMVDQLFPDSGGAK